MSPISFMLLLHLQCYSHKHNPRSRLCRAAVLSRGGLMHGGPRACWHSSLTKYYIQDRMSGVALPPLLSGQRVSMSSQKCQFCPSVLVAFRACTSKARHLPTIGVSWPLWTVSISCFCSLLCVCKIHDPSPWSI